jgi:hypothetical protein
MVSAFATGWSYQRLSTICSGQEIASQAEYAGSIPVIGSEESPVSRNDAEIEAMARDLIATWLDVPLDEVQVSRSR